MTHTEKIESALSDYRNNHIYLDGAGNWRWKIGANGSRTVHPANNLLRGIGGYEEVNDAAHKHTVPEKRFNAVAGMLSAACGESRMYWKRSPYTDPEERSSAYKIMIQTLAACGVTLDERWTRIAAR